MSFRKPAQFSYQTGSPVTGGQQNTALRQDFNKQIRDLTDTLPGHVQDHIKRQRDIQRIMSQTVLAANRSGNPIRGYKF